MARRLTNPNTIRPKPPKRFPISRVRVDLKKFGIKLVEAGAQGTLLWSGDAGALSGMIQAISGATETVHVKHEVDELAWELVRNALIRAMAHLYDEGAGSREPAKGDVEHLRARVEIELDESVAEIPHTLFQNPGAVPLVAVVREQFASWLRLLGLNEAEAKSLANRLPNYLAFAFHEEWRSRRDHYQPVFEHYEGPFTAAAQMAWDWERNRRTLIRQFDEPIFEETFSLREVYVPLRAHWREEAKVRKPRPDDRIYVVDLREAIEDWLKPAEHDDAIRVVSGGPGSGKSSFAKKLAADLCETSQMRVLFFPLQRFPTDKPLQEAMRTWLVDSGLFAESPIRQANFASKVNQLLLIFDGLDELTKPGDLADKMTREFVQEVRANLGIWNAQERRVLVLITGRTIVAQQHRHGLGLGEAQSLAVLPYLLEEADREELARREKAKIHDERLLLGRDQRRDWWRNYSKANGQPDAQFPLTFDASPDIRELTKDPLLNYLVVLSRFHQEEAEHAPRNRNEIYERLLGDVLDRRHAKRCPKERDPVLAGVDDVKDRETFERLLETIATAAWYGDGRTTTLEEARSLIPDDLRARFDSFAGEEGGFVRLLAAVYFQESRQRRDSGHAFEFTHKSFGEYLTARRLVREIGDLHENVSNPRVRYTEDDALRDWCQLTGPKATSMDLLRFLRDEVALRNDEIDGWQNTLTGLFNRNLGIGPPMEAFSDKTYRPTEQKARNAEEALLAALNASARARKPKVLVAVDWPNVRSAGEMLCRLHAYGEHRFGIQSVAKSCLSRLVLSSQLLVRQDLGGADLVGADLHESDLREADLSDADLHEASLIGADLREADLTEADLRDAGLEGADLREAQLRGADLVGADLVGADLRGADLEGTDLREAHLLGAKLQTAELQGADLRDADLEGADLRGADLISADLGGAGLEGADLRDAHLRGADLRRANLKAADLRGADLYGADLRGADLEGANFDGADLSETQGWPRSK